MASITVLPCASVTDSGATAQVVRPRAEDFRKWSTDDVFEFFKETGLEDVAQIFKAEEITGKFLLLVTYDRMTEMEIRPMGRKLTVMQLLEKLKAETPDIPRPSLSQNEGKVFSDPIHGLIELHPLCVRIIDTLQFQRLRHIKQLGGCYFVFQGASHNRFEHSLGVAHLAGQLVRELKSKQPELKINDQDILCVEIAGLCHNLGHGPYSYLFEKVFMPMVHEKENREVEKWRHQDASVKMFDYLVEDNDLVTEFERYGLEVRDRIFIKEQIDVPLKIDKDPKNWPYKGREHSERFLYEIVANKRNGIDVDKCDYLARDCHHLGIANSFDYARFIKFARVAEVEGERQITCRDKEVENIYDMFHTQRKFHRQAYQHKTSNIVEQMLAEALLAANNHLMFKGKKKAMKMSAAISDMEAYSKLTDQVIERILYSDDKKLANAQAIIKKIYNRDLYKYVGEAKCTSENTWVPTDTPGFLEGICKTNEGHQLVKDDLRLTIVTFDYGKEKDNPVDHMGFYSKTHPSDAVQVTSEQVSPMLPTTYQEQVIRLYSCKTDSESVDAAARCFQKWCNQKDWPVRIRTGSLG